jgi:acyl carrier protein
MSTAEVLAEIFSEVLELPAGMDATSIVRANYRKWDSLAHASIIVAIENEFGIVLEVNEYKRIVSFESALALVAEKSS